VDEREVVTGAVGIEGWFRRWVEDSAIVDLHDLVSPAMIVMVVGLVLAVGVAMRRSTPGSLPVWPLAVPPLVGLVAWFVLAPEPRYGSPLVWILAAITVAACFHRLGGGEHWPSARRYVVALVVLAVSPMVMHPLLSATPPYRPLPAWKRVLAENLLIPAPPDEWQSRAYAPRLARYVTRSGLELAYAPRTCFDTPVPCTPNPSPALRLRDPARPASGFTVDGVWEMQFWPANRRAFGAAIAELDRRTGRRGCEAASRNTSLRPRS
jgi:hypothetical protein